VLSAVPVIPVIAPTRLLLMAVIKGAVLFIVIPIHPVPFAVESVALTIQRITFLIGDMCDGLMVTMTLTTLPAIYLTAFRIQVAHHRIEPPVHRFPLAIDLGSLLFHPVVVMGKRRRRNH